MILLLLALLVIAGAFKDPSQHTSRSCRALPRAKHPADLLSPPSNHHAGYLIWGRGIGPSGGVGNDFIFWPAVFAASLLSGRMAVLDDISRPVFKMATICNGTAAYLDCSVPLLSSILTNEEWSHKDISSKIVKVDVRDVLQMPDNRFLRVDGYFRSSNWWQVNHFQPTLIVVFITSFVQSNRTLARCMRHVLNCTESSSAVQKAGRHLCLERAAMSFLAGTGPGSGMRRFADTLSARLVGEVDRDAVREYLAQSSSVYRSSSRPLFDAALHLRLQVTGCYRLKHHSSLNIAC